MTEELLRWLPRSSELVIVSEGPFLSAEELPRKDPFQVVRSLPAFLAIYPEAGSSPEKRENPLRSKQLLLAVEGARRFGPPRGHEGATAFEGCQLYFFGERVERAFEDWVDYVGRRVEVASIVGDVQILCVFLRLEPGDEEERLYVASLGGRTLLIGTSETYVREVVERATEDPLESGQAREEEHALLPTVMPFVDVSSPVWAGREYRRTSHEEDPTNPIVAGKYFQRCVEPDEYAVGVAFSYDPTRPDVAILRYLSRNELALAIAERAWNWENGDLRSRVSAEKPGVFRIDIDERSLKARMAGVQLAGYLGHAVFP